MNDKFVQAQVSSIFPLTNSILQIFLSPDEYIHYEAGQYLKIITEEEAFSFSIANAPLGSHQYELHIRHGRDNPSSTSLISPYKK